MAAPPRYRRNLYVLWSGCFFTGVGGSLVTPFLPLFIDTLGDFSRQELAFYSGIIIAAPHLFQALISPLWGRLADRYGRKPMLLRASLGMAVLMVVTGFVNNVWVLLLVRSLFGVFSGFGANAVSLIAIQVPKDKSGKALGTLNTAHIGGSLLGPLFGGAVVVFSGYASVFFVTGGILLLVFFLILFFVKEDFVPARKKDREATKGVFSLLNNKSLVVSLFFTTLMISLTTSSINPILSLYVRDLLPPDGGVELWSGVVAAAPGLVTVLAAPYLGALGDRIGASKILMFGLIVQAAVFLPMAFVTSVWQLVVLRLILGLSTAFLTPSAQSLIAHNTPTEVTSRVFSYNQSFQASGKVLGPLVGAAISAAFDIQYIFFATMIFALINLVNVTLVSRKKEEA